MGEEPCLSGELGCIDQGRRACDVVRKKGYKGSRDCYSYSVYKAPQTKSSHEYFNPTAEWFDYSGVRLFSSKTSFNSTRMPNTQVLATVRVVRVRVSARVRARVRMDAGA